MAMARVVAAVTLCAAMGCSMTVTEAMLVPPRRAALPVLSEAVSRHNLELTTADGVTLRGWSLERPDSERVVLFFYGNRSSLLSSSFSLYWLAEALRANVVAFDYRGYGFSDGEARLDAIVDDSLAVYDHAVGLAAERELPVVVVGQSMGTASALRVAANREVAALVLLAPPASVDDVLDAIRATTPWYVSVEADESLSRLRASPVTDAEHVRARALFVHAAGDVVASPASVERLMRASGAPDEVECEVSGGHGDVTTENPAVRRCIRDFFAPRPTP